MLDQLLSPVESLHIEKGKVLLHELEALRRTEVHLFDLFHDQILSNNLKAGDLEDKSVPVGVIAARISTSLLLVNAVRNR